MVVSVCGGSVVGWLGSAKRRILAGGRLVGRGLVRRLHGVHGIAVRRDVAVGDELGDAVDRRGRRVAGDSQRDAVLIDGRDGRLGRARRCVRVDRGAAADQPEMVEEGAAEGALEEVVGQRELLGDLPELLVGAGVVMTHHQGA